MDPINTTQLNLDRLSSVAFDRVHMETGGCFIPPSSFHRASRRNTTRIPARPTTGLQPVFSNRASFLSARPGQHRHGHLNHPVSSVRGFASVLPGNRVPSKTAIGPRWSRHLCRMPCEVRLALTRGHVPSISTANGSSRVATNTADVILHPVSVQRSPVLQDAERPAGGGSGLHQVVSVGAGTGTASGSV